MNYRDTREERGRRVVFCKARLCLLRHLCYCVECVDALLAGQELRCQEGRRRLARYHGAWSGYAPYLLSWRG